MSKKAIAIFQLLRLHKPIGFFLILWPTLMSLWIAAAGKPDISIVLIFSAGALIMRSAGCAINDIFDRHFDGHVERTKNRPIVSKRISLVQAMVVFALLVALAFLLVLKFNFLTIALSFLALLLASIYPLMKRYIHFPQVVLGLAFGIAIPMAFAAQLNTVPNIAWLLYCANLCWVLVYDTEYAMVDRQDDIRIGVKSTAILFGSYDRMIVFILQCLTLALFLILGLILKLGFPYYLGWICAVGLSAYQQYLIKDREPAKCFQAFLNNNMVGAALFFGLLFAY